MNESAPGTTPKAVAKRLASQGVEAVACCMVDSAGVGRLMAVPLRSFEDACTNGVGMSTLFSVFLVNDHIVSAPGFEGPSGDFRLIPDPAATVAIPHMPGWALAPVDIRDLEGQPFHSCPRSFLERQVAALSARGIEMRAAFELEFFVGTRAGLPPGVGTEEADPTPTHLGPGYSPQVLAERSAFALDLVRAVEEAGIGVHKFHPEYSIGQWELAFPVRDPVGAADAALIARQVIRAVCRTHGLWPSFAPVAFLGAVGNGAHLHYSLWKGAASRRRNLFSGGDASEGMHAEAEAFTAGVLSELPALTGVCCPSVPSYYRLKPHLWSGATGCWGVENREAALRFIQGPAATRATSANMEVKVVDGAGNPYLVLGSLIAAGLAGLERELTLPEPVSGDPSALGPAERKAAGVVPLPKDLGAAIRNMERSDVLHVAMGDLLFGSFLATRRGEWNEYRKMEPEAIVRAHRWRY